MRNAMGTQLHHHPLPWRVMFANAMRDVGAGRSALIPIARSGIPSCVRKMRSKMSIALRIGSRLASMMCDELISRTDFGIWMGKKKGNSL